MDAPDSAPRRTKGAHHTNRWINAAYTKLVSELVMLDFIPRTQGQVYYTHTSGEVSKVTITSAGLEARSIRVVTLPPHLPNYDIYWLTSDMAHLVGSKKMSKCSYIGIVLVTE
jgi:hypothetical protein